MTNQNSKLEKDQFKENFAGRIKHFVLNLIEFIDSLPNEMACRIIGDQLMRSGSSVGANYFEAKAASSRRDFINYFNHSLKSANESKFWLDILLETKKCNTQAAQDLLNEITEISKILAASILTMKGKKRS
jgi:four helix bundle protein